MHAPIFNSRPPRPSRIAVVTHRRTWGGLALALLFAGCGGSSTEPEETIYSLEITPRPVEMQVAESRTLVATLRTQTGEVVTGRPVTWNSSQPSVATVSNGVVQALTAGVTNILATSEGRTADAQVTVVAPPPASLQFSTHAATLKVGDTITIATTVRDANGNVLPGYHLNSWGTNNDRVATVNLQGRVTATGVGTARIVAYLNATVSDSAVITVTP